MVLPPHSSPPRVVKTQKTARIRRNPVDLHCHTTYSDGEKSVTELLDLAVERKLSALAITDHDNIDAYFFGKELAEERGIELIPGVELSTVHEGRDIHLLGYFFDPTNLGLNLELKEQHRQRRERARAILKKLALLGVEISFERVLSFSKGGTLGRPHIAQALLAEEYVSSFSEAFQKFLGEDGAAFVEKKGLSVEQGIQLIRRAGGIAVLAHPLRTGVDDLLDNLPGWGLGGIEVVTGSQKGASMRRLKEYAAKHDLVCTGGSDYHGDRSANGLGTLPVFYDVVEELNNKLEIQKSEQI